MRVLVTGAAGPAGASLLGQLSARGIDVVGTDLAPRPRLDAIPVLAAKPVADPGYLAELRGLVAELGVDLVIPTVSEELPLVAAAGMPEVLVGPLDGVRAAADKWLTHGVLERAGVPVPRSVVGGRSDDALRSWIGLPCLTKPRVSRGGRGVEVHDQWPSAQYGAETIIGEFVPGAEYCPNVWIAPEPAQDVVVVLEKTGLKQGRVANATGVRRTTDAAVADVAVAACRALGLTGPADVDVRRRADGTPVVLEVNARFGANSAHAPEVLDAVLAQSAQREVSAWI